MRQTAPIHEFADAEALAQALASRTGEALTQAIDQKGHAVLAVSGGTTPGRYFDRLSETEIDWDRIVVTLVDERCVPPDHQRSNARLVAERLLKGRAEAARFLPLFGEGRIDAGTAARSTEESILRLGRLDACILGMGTDGHTASFFPGGDNLAKAIDPQTYRHVIAIEAPGAGEPRLTLTLPVIAGATFLALHIEGDAKRTVFEHAMQAGPPEEMPIRAVIDRAGIHLEVFWTGG